MSIKPSEHRYALAFLWWWTVAFFLYAGKPDIQDALIAFLKETP